MLEESVISVLSKEYITTVGFPIAAFTVILLVLVFLIRDCTRRNIDCQHSKDDYVASFFKQSTEAQDKHTAAMNNLTNELRNITEELKGISVKVDVYAKIIDKQIDMQIKRQIDKQFNNIDTKNTTDIDTKNTTDIDTKNTTDIDTKNTTDINTKNTTDVNTK